MTLAEAPGRRPNHRSSEGPSHHRSRHPSPHDSRRRGPQRSPPPSPRRHPSRRRPQTTRHDPTRIRRPNRRPHRHPPKLGTRPRPPRPSRPRFAGNPLKRAKGSDKSTDSYSSITRYWRSALNTVGPPRPSAVSEVGPVAVVRSVFNSARFSTARLSPKGVCDPGSNIAAQLFAVQ